MVSWCSGDLTEHGDEATGRVQRRARMTMDGPRALRTLGGGVMAGLLGSLLPLPESNPLRSTLKKSHVAIALLRQGLREFETCSV